MIQALAAGAIVLAGGWLAFIALLCAFRPEQARAGLASMGSSWAIQFGEHIPRALVGLAMVVRADASKAPELFSIGGWFLIASSLLILLLPRSWHNRYAVWWADRIPLAAYRVLALPTLCAGIWLAYAAL